MNCTQFQQQLEAAVDNRQLAQSPELSEHTTTCFSCRELWDEYLLLETAIAQWRGTRLDLDLTDRVLAAYRAERATAPVAIMTSNQTTTPPPSESQVTLVRVPTPASGTRWWPMLIPAIAALALAVMVLISREGSRERQVVQPDIKPSMPPEELADLSEIVDDAKSAWLGLARSTADRTRGLSVFIPSLRSAPGDEAPSPPMDVDMLEDMHPGLKPVPDEFRRAFEFLIDAAQWDESQTT